MAQSAQKVRRCLLCADSFRSSLSGKVSPRCDTAKSNNFPRLRRLGGGGQPELWRCLLLAAVHHVARAIKRLARAARHFYGCGGASSPQAAFCSLFRSRGDDLAKKRFFVRWIICVCVCGSDCTVLVAGRLPSSACSSNYFRNKTRRSRSRVGSPLMKRNNGPANADSG